MNATRGGGGGRPTSAAAGHTVPAEDVAGLVAKASRAVAGIKAVTGWVRGRPWATLREREHRLVQQAETRANKQVHSRRAHRDGMRGSQARSAGRHPAQGSRATCRDGSVWIGHLRLEIGASYGTPQGLRAGPGTGRQTSPGEGTLRDAVESRWDRVHVRGCNKGRRGWPRPGTSGTDGWEEWESGSTRGSRGRWWL